MESNLHYSANHLESPNRPPVILIHGAGGFHLSWPPHIRRMENYPVYALDLNGHGESMNGVRTTIEEHSRDVLRLIRSLGLKQAILAGHSMGGAVALTIAVEQPRLLSGLILISTGAKLRVASTLLEAASRKETFPQAVESVIQNSFSQNADSRIRELTRQRMLLTNPSTLHADLLACQAFNALDALPHVSVPTLILCGSEDVMTPPRLSRALYEKIAGSQFELVPNAGHMLMLERPAALKGFLEEFLNTLE